MNFNYKNYKTLQKKQEIPYPSYGWSKNFTIHQHPRKEYQLPADTRMEIQTDSTLYDLKALTKDVEVFIEELQDDLTNPIKIKLLQKEEISKQISYLEDFEEEIQDFMHKNKIKEENLEEFNYNKGPYEKEELEQQLEKLKPKDSAQGDGKVYLTHEIQMIEKMNFLKELEKLDSKLEGIDCLMGNKEMFAKESLYEQFQQIYHDIELLHPQQIVNIEKKMSLLNDEVKRLTNEQKTSTDEGEQEAKKMKVQLKELFDEVNFSPKYFNNFYESNELQDIKNLLFNYKYFINKGC